MNHEPPKACLRAPSAPLITAKQFQEYLNRTSLKVIYQKAKEEVELIFPSFRMIKACRADDFEFFTPFISSGKLTERDMHHAAQRYHLGKTKSGTPIFWMIDEMLTPLDAHIGENEQSDVWISQLLKARDPTINDWIVYHCLFGLHLLYSDPTPTPSEGEQTEQSSGKKNTISGNHNIPISIVESEVSAVVLSELFPESLWLAYTSIPHLHLDYFEPLQGRNVTIYPRTDPHSANYLFFDDFAATVRKSYDINISVATILEDHTTEEQKSRCIDLLEFIVEPPPQLP